MKVQLGNVAVTTEKNRGHPPEFWVNRAMVKIIAAGENMDPHVQQQVHEFKDQVKSVIYQSILGAIRSDRTTVAGELRRLGFSELAEHIARSKL